MKITEYQYIHIAKLLNCEVASLKAVAEVESTGSGYLADGQPKILFEGHVFWRRLRLRGINPYKYLPKYGSILYPKWTKIFYKGGYDEHKRLQKAMEIHREAALESASYGAFQIMGFNFRACGYRTLQEFINDAFSNGDEYPHLLMFAGFIKSNKVLLQALQDKRWQTFARIYNGAGYKKNKYDTKLENAYKKYSQ